MLKVTKNKEYKSKYMSLYSTSVCNLACDECIMGHLMKNDSKYHMSLEEIKLLIKYSEEANYEFKFIISGGEPLLWNNLEKGLNLLKSSKITKEIVVFSNAMFHDKLNSNIMDSIDVIRVSHYFYNDKHMQELKDKYPDKVEIVERTGFWENPKSPVPKEIASPVNCLTPHCWLYNYEVYSCPHCKSIALGNGSKIKLCKPLGPKFLEELGIIKSNMSEEICSMCISNGKVRNYVKKLVNVSNGKEDLKKWGYNTEFYANENNLSIPEKLIQINIRKKSF